MTAETVESTKKKKKKKKKRESSRAPRKTDTNRALIFIMFRKIIC
jgi:hypothetical protein